MTQIINQEVPILCDGAFGTYFEYLFPEWKYQVEEANLIKPEYVLSVHQAYLDSGAKWIRTNTFKIPKNALTQKEREEFLIAGYELAKKAILKEPLKEVMANIGPIDDEYLIRLGNQSVTKREILLEEVMVFAALDARIYNFESFDNLDDIRLALDWLATYKKEVTILIQFSINDSGYTFSGHYINRLLKEVDDLPMVHYVGLSCGLSSGQMRQFLESLTYYPKKPLSIFPNGGQQTRAYQGHSLSQINFFTEQMKIMVSMGAKIIGGCCQTTPEFIKSLSKVEFKVEKEYIHQKEEGAKPIENDFLEKLKSGKKVIAVELDPPFHQDLDKLIETAQKIKNLPVDMITLADSPMARSRMDSVLAGIRIKYATGMEVMPHICCRDKNSLAVRGMFLGAHANDLKNFLIITGDPLASNQKDSVKKVFNFNSISMMNYIHQMNEDLELIQPFIFGGAINQSRPNFEVELKRVGQKIEAGAKYFLTQPIFSKTDMERLKIIKERYDCHILCGIMPLISYKNAFFIKNEIHGIEVPDEILELYDPSMDKEEGEWVGVHLAKRLMEALKDIASGYYFMLPFNRVSILEKLFKEER